MGKIRIYGAVAVALMVAACEKQAMVGSPELESIRLENLYRELDSLAGLYPCEDSGEWRFTAVGEKACGGPAGYLAYSTELDTVSFLDKVARYTDLQREYNVKWDVVSDCMFLTPPTGISCEGGEAKLVWSPDTTISSPN